VTLHPADLQYFKSMSLTYRPDKATHTLLPAGSEWKYSDRGVDLHSTGWKLIDYDDSGWSTGIGVFGFGDAADTVLSFGRTQQRLPLLLLPAHPGRRLRAHGPQGPPPPR